MKSLNPKVAVVGNGYWGKNLVRNFRELGALAYVCDVREEALREVKAQYGIPTTQDPDDIVRNDQIQAVVIAAPAAQHYELAKRFLQAGKDVYVEKPLALRSSEGRELVSLAATQERILMVGHILEYHPAINELKKLIRQGELGRIQYIYSSRLNLGKLRTEENILWSFAPHDISAILYLLDETPQLVSTHGGHYLSPRVYDTTLSTLEFASGVNAHIFVSWLHPFKEQKLAIIGDRRMAVFDDVETEHKLLLYSHRIEWRDRVPVARKEEGQAVPIAKDEPLRLECKHFLYCVQTRQRPQTDGERALQVLEVLEACEASLGDRGRLVDVRQQTLQYFAHSTAVIDRPCEIGEGTKIWHFSHVMSGAKIGEHCNFGQNVLISSGVHIGNNVKIQNNVSVYTGVEIENDVFCGPSMVFTNVVNPRSHIVRKDEYKKTLIKEGATIGANATVVCGVTIGRHAFVAAGAVITKDVPAYSLVMGVPGRHAGWICECGVRLPQSGQEVKCPACGKIYIVDSASCREANVESAAMSHSG
jgi:UDP-2-acetamido-3-amino-2,3-dideoxy-glucuronate N-acetyltransferase